MNVLSFLKSKILYIICHLIAITLTVLILTVLNPQGGFALSIFIGTLYMIFAVIPLLAEYIQKRNFYENLIKIFDSLDKKNLIAEMIKPPSFVEGIILYDVLKGSNKAMLEEINRYKYMQEEYREYIELWVHEIKTPIAASKLIAQNNKNAVTDSIEEEIEKIENFVEQVLFYSRSSNVDKDYIIKKVNLEKICFDVLKKNSKLFIQNKIKITTDNLNVNVFSDAKWLEFIINQVLTNSVKYKKVSDAEIKFYTSTNENNIILSIEDNGIGIQSSEISKIFDKGFTGTNGRKVGHTTGMGLYICRKLCNKLGLAINAESKIDEGTTISIVFPKSSMMDVIK